MPPENLPKRKKRAPIIAAGLLAIAGGVASLNSEKSSDTSDVAAEKTLVRESPEEPKETHAIARTTSAAVKETVPNADDLDSLPLPDIAARARRGDIRAAEVLTRAIREPPIPDHILREEIALENFLRENFGISTKEYLMLQYAYVVRRDIAYLETNSSTDDDTELVTSILRMLLLIGYDQEPYCAFSLAALGMKDEQELKDFLNTYIGFFTHARAEEEITLNTKNLITDIKKKYKL